MNVELIEPETSTELTVQDRAALALGSSKTEQNLKELAAKNTAIVAILDKAGRAQAHGAAMEIKSARVHVEKTAKEVREDATEFSKAVIKEEKRLVAIIQPEEIRLLGLRDGWDTEQQRIKEEAERVERARITAIHERIAIVRNFHAMALECRTADRVQTLIDRALSVWLAFDFEQDFAEFSNEAQTAYDDTHARMVQIHAQKFAEEAERARIKAEQEAEAAKLKAEREAHAAEAKKLADERAALEADRKAMAAERAAIAAKIEADRLAQEATAQVDADAKALAEYQAAISVPAVEVAQVEEVAPVEPMRLTGQLLSIAIKPMSPSAGALIGVIAQHFNVPGETAAEWLDSADFTTYY